MGRGSSAEDDHEQESKAKRLSSRKKKRRSRSVSPIRTFKKRDRMSKSRSRRCDRSPYDKQAEKSNSPHDSIPGYSSMAPKERTELSIQKAIANAKAADEDFIPKESREMLQPSFNLSVLENGNQPCFVESIESDGFAQSTFKSSRSRKNTTDVPEMLSHETAIFGNTSNLNASLLDTSEAHPRSLFHRNLVEESNLRWDRWQNLLGDLREKVL